MRSRFLALVGLGAVILAAGGCEVRPFMVPTDPGGGSGTITITLVRTAPTGPSVPAGSSATFQATVRQDGTPMSGISVTFSSSPTGSGTFSPLTASTDSQGVAQTIFNVSTTPPSNSVTITSMATVSSNSFTDTELLMIAP